MTDDAYEQGYQDGESSGYADWIIAVIEQWELDGIESPDDFIAQLLAHYTVTKKV